MDAIGRVDCSFPAFKARHNEKLPYQLHATLALVQTEQSIILPFVDEVAQRAGPISVDKRKPTVLL